MYKMNDNTKAVGDKVVLKNLEQNPDRYTVGGIHMPLNYENCKLVKAMVVSVGPEAEKEGLKPGQVVMYDKHSIFSETGKGTEKEGEVVVCKTHGIQYVADNGNVIPIGKRVLVEKIGKKTEFIGNIILTSLKKDDDKDPVWTKVVGMGLSEEGLDEAVKIGTEVLMKPGNCSTIKLDGKDVMIFNISDMLAIREPNN